MYKPNLKLMNKNCRACGEPLFEDPEQNFTTAVMAAMEVFDEEEVEDFLDFPGESIMKDGLCGKCCFNEWYWDERCS